MPDVDLYSTLSTATQTIETAAQNTTINWTTYKSTSNQIYIPKTGI